MVDGKPHDIFGTSILLKDHFKANISILNRQEVIWKRMQNLYVLQMQIVSCQRHFLPGVMALGVASSRTHIHKVILCFRESRMGNLWS